MKHIWYVHGTFFEWEMTVKVRPAENSPKKITEEDQSSAIARMKRLEQPFHDTASLHEYGIEFESLTHWPE